MTLSRRRFLQLAGAASLVPGCALPSGDDVEDGAAGLTRAPERPDLFPFGVSAGSTTSTSAMLWTHLATRPRGRAVLSVVEAGDGRPGTVAFEREVTASEAGFVHARVTGLRPGARYTYAFTLNDRERARSRFGTFRCAPADDALEEVVFGGTACTNQVYRPFPTLLEAAKHELDFFVHAGDHVYCTGARSPEQFRAKYAENWTSAGMQAVLGSTSWFGTWDDHEVANDYDPETTPSGLVDTARAAFFEHHPLDEAENDRRIWRSTRWGRTVEMFVLDGRSERRPSSRKSRDAEYISPAQLAWLEQGLARSNALVKLVVNSVPILNYPLFWDLDWAQQHRWEGYAAQREQVLTMTERFDNVWWLSGDLHHGAINRVERGMKHREVVMGPGGNDIPLHIWANVQGFEFKTRTHNFTRFRVSPQRKQLEVEFIDGAGAKLGSRTYPLT